MHRATSHSRVVVAPFLAAVILGCAAKKPPPSDFSALVPPPPGSTGPAKATPAPARSPSPSSSANARPAGATMAPAQPAIAADRLYYPTGERDTSMLLLERSGPAKVRVGKPYNYQITVTNLTNTPLRGVAVQELLPASFVTRDGDANPGGGSESDSLAAPKPAAAVAPPQTAPRPSRTHMVGELGPKESRTIKLSGVPSDTGPINACTSVTCNPTLCTSAQVISPQLRLSKEAVGSGDLCQLQTIRYTAANTGTGDLTGVRIDDQLPGGLAMENGSNRVAINVGAIPQGQSRTADVRVKATAAGEFSSAAVATADDEVTAKSEPVAMAIKAPQLEVALKAPEKEYLGEAIRYEVTVKNAGNAVARSPMLRLDAGGDVAAAPAAGEARLASSRDNGQSVGELAPGASRTITIPYNTRAEGDLHVNAIATDPCAKPATASGVTRVSGIPALLLSAVDSHDPIRVGEDVTYTITVLNQGFGADRDVRVVVTLPEGEQYLSSNGASDATLDGNHLTFAPVPNIAPKQTLTWTITVKAIKAGDVRLRVDMTSKSLIEPAIKMEPTRLY